MIVNHQIIKDSQGKYNSTLHEYAFEINSLLFLIVLVRIFKICLLKID